MTRRFCRYLFEFVAASIALAIGPIAAHSESTAGKPIDIGTRVEMFVDERLIDPASLRGVSLELQTPVRREVVLTTDKPWEGRDSAYFTVLQDGSRYRLYYRGSHAKSDASEEQYTCYAESTDG